MNHSAQIDSEIKKPKKIMDYNMTKSAVDKKKNCPTIHIAAAPKDYQLPYSTGF